MEILVETLKACADEKRIRIIKLLHKRAMCVCELAYVLDISQPAVSKHIKKMLHAGLIVGRQEGFWTIYSLAPRAGHAKKVLRYITGALGDDDVVVQDLKKAAVANKHELCCKK